MIKIVEVYARPISRGKTDFRELFQVVNEIGEDRILYITADSKTGYEPRTKYTIFYRDDN